MDKSLKGLHHVTAITDDIVRNYKFFTEILGMRLIKKTVNQDDIQTYHTYYGDHVGTPGTGMTFFGNANSQPGTHGTDSITRVGLRVPNDKALAYYLNRFEEYNVKNEGIQEVFNKKVLPFEEPDGQRYQLVSDEGNEGMAAGEAWDLSPVPNEFAVHGVGPVEMSVSEYEVIKDHLIEFYGFDIVAQEENTVLLEVDAGGNGAQIILKEDTESPVAKEGNGEVHHLALRVENRKALKAWEALYEKNNFHHSGFIERHYFGALYVRVGRILFELSSDDPGFTVDEPYETLGECLALPGEFEEQREAIEHAIRPFDTTVDHSENK